MIATPALVPSANLINKDMYEIEENSILTTDAYIHHSWPRPTYH
jgi:hypothetical protein